MYYEMKPVNYEPIYPNYLMSDQQPRPSQQVQIGYPIHDEPLSYKPQFNLHPNEKIHYQNNKKIEITHQPQMPIPSRLPPPIRMFSPPRYQDINPKNYRQEAQQIHNQRPILFEERVAVGMDRPFTYKRHYDVHQPYHRQPYECSECIQTYLIPDTDIKPEWVKYRGVNMFSHMLNELMKYERRAENLRIELAQQPEFNIAAFYSQIINLQECYKYKNLNQVQACEEQIDFYLFQKFLKKYNIIAQHKDIKLLMNKYKIITKSKQLELEIFTDYREFYQIVFPFSKKEIYDYKMNFITKYVEQFSNKTEYLIESLFRTLLSQEDAINFYRKEIIYKNIELERVWTKLNPDNLQTINVENFKGFLQDYGFQFERNIVAAFFQRIDKVSMGQITYADFKEEFTERVFEKNEDEIIIKQKQQEQEQEKEKFELYNNL